MRKLSRILALALVMIIAVSMMTMFAFEASAATINASTKLYLKPNSNWTQANARFAAYFFGNGDEWVSMTDSNGDGIYECTSPNKSYTNVIFCRMNPSSTTNSWDTKWDQTNDLTYDGNKNLYTVAAGAWSKGSGSWSYFCNNNHTWNSGTVTKAATCSATGTMKYTCTKCSTTKTEVIEKTAHSFSGASCTVCGTANPDYCAHSSKTEVNTATCTTAGKHYFDCDNCDEIFDETSVDALGHNYVNGVCSRCDLIITYFVNSAKWENVSAHMWIEGGAGTTWPGNAMTKTGDTVNGFDVYYIESATAYANIIFNNNNAGSQTADLKLAPGQYYNLSDNTWYGSLDAIPELDPLATGNFLVGSFNGWNTTLNEFKLDEEGGSTSYVSIELEEGAKIEFKVMFDGAWYGSNTAFTSETASGDFSNSVSGNATLTALCKGTYVFALTEKTLKVTFVSHTPGAAADCENAQVCTTCGTQLAAKLGHDMIVYKAVAPTCTATGLTEGSHCSRCDHKVAQTVVDALGHDMIVDKAVAPTCTSTGLTEASHCSRCDHKVAQEVVDALGHDMIVDKAVSPTCTATGLTEGSHCSRCDHKVAQKVVDALGHDMVTDKAVAPDCLNTGLTEGSHCSRCDHKVAQEVVDALGHDYKAVVTAPTFDAEGYTTHTCSRCSDSYKDFYVNALVAVATVNGVRYETLTEAIAVGGEIILLDDVVLEGSLVIPAGKVVTLNLDGHTISQSKECVGSYSMIENKGTLVITGNGKVSFTDTSAGDPTFGWGSYTIYNTGTLVVENGTIEHLGEQAFATHMICAIFQYSGSTTINGGVISTPAYRSARLWMGEMVINGGEFDGQLWVQSVDSTSKLTINGGTFGPNGRDGSSVFVGNIDNTGVSHAVEFTVTGGSFTTKIGCNDATNLTGKLIVGGSFSESAVANTNSALVAEGYKFGANGDVVEIVNYEAQIGNVKYETLAEAIAAANAGDRVVLLDDVSLEATIVLGAGCDVVLDLNGKTITAGFTAEKVEVILAKDGAKLTVTGNGTMIANGNGTYVEAISAIDGANVTIENGTFVSTGCTAIYATRGAVITINGGHYDAQTPYEKDNRYYTLDINEGESNLGVITVNGGTYVNFDPANHTTDGTALPDMLAEGLHTTKSGNVYTVGAHKYDAVVTAPDCENKGYTTHTCVCGDSYVTDEVDALGHDMIVEKAVAPTCTATGLTEGSHCSRCDHKVAQEVVDALGHDMIVDKAVAPTCTATGLTEGSHCSRCDHKVAQTVVDALGHDMIVDKAVAPTCTATGLTEGSHCSRCDHTVAQVVVPANGHTEVTIPGTAATCTSTGLTEGKKCSVCYTVLVAQQAIGIKPHTEVEVPSVAPTCTESGLSAGKKCSVCQTVIVPQTTIDALGHTEEIIPGTAATCTSTGLSEGKKCSVCEEILVAQNEIAKLEHTFVNGECACGEQDPHYTNPTTPNPEDEFESDNIIVKILKFILMLFKTFRAFFGSF